jgi:hypothetical protein
MPTNGGADLAGQGDGHITQLSAHSFETLAADHPLSFPIPFGDRPGSEWFERSWHLMSYAFDLPDPATFPPMGHLMFEPDREVLRRYVFAASDMADSHFLRYRTRFSFSLTATDSSEMVTLQDFPPSETIRGFSVLLRQFNAPDEHASFDAVRKLLGNINHNAAEESVDERKRQIAAWRGVVRQLRTTQLSVLVGRRLQQENRWHRGTLPGEEYSPHYLIGLFNYGEDIHWGDRRDELAAFNRDPFWSGWQRLYFFEAVSSLAYVYLGFSVLVEAALRSPDA